MAATSNYPTWPQSPQPVVRGVGLRVAILVIGTLAGAVMLAETMQVVQIFSVLHASNSQVVGGAIVVAMLWVMALAAAWGAPGPAALLFTATATGGFILGVGSIFGDMMVWGSVAAILAVMCLVAQRRMRRVR